MAGTGGPRLGRGLTGKLSDDDDERGEESEDAPRGWRMNCAFLRTRQTRRGGRWDGLGG